MLAAIEQKTIDSVNTTGLAVSFELALIIRAPVFVLPPIAGDNKLIFLAPPITIPGTGSPSIPANCVVIWELEYDPQVFASLGFQSNGVAPPQIDCLPEGLTIRESELLYAEGLPTRWRMEVVNGVSGLQSFKYFLNVEGILNNLIQSQTPIPVTGHHDPTIVVTQEPIG